MTSNLAVRCVGLAAFLTIAIGRADLGVPDGICTEANEESSDTTSLLQVSMEHAVQVSAEQPATSQLGQDSMIPLGQHQQIPEHSEEFKLEHDWAELLARSWAYGEKHFSMDAKALSKQMPSLSQDLPSLEALASDPRLEALANDPQARSMMTASLLKGTQDSAVSPHSTQTAHELPMPQNASFSWFPFMEPQNGYAALPSLSMEDVPGRIAGDTDLYMFSPDSTNAATFLLVLFVVVCIILKPGHKGGSANSGGFPTWVVLTLVVSYVSWGFGFFMYNTSYFMTGLFMGKEIIMSRDFQTGHPAVFKESPHLIIVNLIQANHCTGTYCATSQFAGWFYLLFSVGDPLLKLSLMVVGSYLSHFPQHVHIARQCLITCRVLSKWASPMYYFLLIAHCQFLLMDQPPGLSTRAVLDIGWVGFTLFCVTNVVSAVSIPLPELPPPREKQNASHGLSEHYKLFVFRFVSVAAGLYFSLIVLGVSSDLVSLNTESYAQFMKGFLDPRTEKAFHTSASIVGCMNVLLSRFFTSGQLIPLVAFFILAGLVIVMALADMCFLTLSAFYVYKGDKEAFQYWISQSRVTRQCSAVDVLVVGVLLASLSKSLVIEFGVHFLLYAEILRYIVVYPIMENTAQYIEDPNYVEPISDQLKRGGGKGMKKQRK